MKPQGNASTATALIFVRKQQANRAITMQKKNKTKKNSTRNFPRECVTQARTEKKKKTTHKTTAY